MSLAHCHYHVEPAQLPQHRGWNQVVDQSGQRSRIMLLDRAVEHCALLSASAEQERLDAKCDRDG